MLGNDDKFSLIFIRFNKLKDNPIAVVKNVLNQRAKHC